MGFFVAMARNACRSEDVEGATPSAPAPDAACGMCGTKLGQILAHGLAGCPGCYAAFDRPLRAALRRIHAV